MLSPWANESQVPGFLRNDLVALDPKGQAAVTDGGKTR